MNMAILQLAIIQYYNILQLSIIYYYYYYRNRNRTTRHILFLRALSSRLSAQHPASNSSINTVAVAQAQVAG